MIKLFDSNATEFDTLGIGVLNDAIKCLVSEERNGPFELELQYPIDGIHYDDIKLRNIIVTKPNPFASYQAFRIYYISKPINCIVTINAEHISYDMSGMTVSPFTANDVASALSGLKSNSTPSCPFDFSTDKTVIAPFQVKVPSTLRSLLGGTEGSILDVYGTGEYEFSNYNVYFRTHRGEDRGVVIRYGKNLTDLTQEENCSKVYTHVYPYWAGTQYSDGNSSDVLVTLPEKTVAVSGTFSFTRVLPIDLGSSFSEMPTVDQLRAEAQNYITQNGIGKPEVSLKVSFVQLEQTEEYEQLKLLESVYLCDTVTVIFEELGVNSTAKCIKTEYNAITDKYESLEFGDSRTNLAKTIASQSQEISNIPSASFMEKEIVKATKLITGGLGGYVMFNSSSGQLQPDEILILGEESGGDIKKAQNVWRFNMGGLGFSSTGYNGTYKSIALTVDPDGNKGTVIADQVVAEGIQGGTIEAALTIIAPLIQNAKTNPTFYVDQNGNITGAKITGNTEFNMRTPGKAAQLNWGGTWSDSLTVVSYKNNEPGGNEDAGLGVCQRDHRFDRAVYVHYNDVRLYDDSYNADYAQWGSKSSSDKRLKKNIKNANKKTIRELFQRLRFVSFKFKDDESEIIEHGMIAQEVEPLIDELGFDKRAFVKKGGDGYYKLTYPNFERIGLVAIQDLYEEVDKLQNEIKQLREEIK